MRQLDPAAHAVVQEGKEETPFNHDTMAAAILYLESTALHRKAERMLQELGSGDYNPAEFKKLRPIRKQAYKAIAKAVEYAPEHTPY